MVLNEVGIDTILNNFETISAYFFKYFNDTKLNVSHVSARGVLRGVSRAGDCHSRRANLIKIRTNS